MCPLQRAGPSHTPTPKGSPTPRPVCCRQLNWSQSLPASLSLSELPPEERWWRSGDGTAELPPPPPAGCDCTPLAAARGLCP